MSVSGRIDSLNLIDGLHMSPIPLEVGNEMTTSKWLMAIQDKINKVIADGNAWQENAEQYTDEKVKLVNQELQKLYDSLTNGDIIQDGSIDLDKMSSNFIANLEKLIVENVDSVAKFATFGLDDDGHFVAYVPNKWNDIKFTTDMEGHLILEY